LSDHPTTCCRTCGRARAVDSCGYCSECYPYDGATRAHKQAVEQHDTPLDRRMHNAEHDSRRDR
jgi:hypothetical protein